MNLEPASHSLSAARDAFGTTGARDADNTEDDRRLLWQRRLSDFTRGTDPDEKPTC